MDETLKEINKTGYCVIDIEDSSCRSKRIYLVNLKDKVIEKKCISEGGRKYDIIKKIKSSDINIILDSYPKFKIAYIDDDYIFNTQYPLIRFHEIKRNKSIF